MHTEHFHRRDVAGCPLDAYSNDVAIEDLPDEVLTHFGTCPDCGGCEGCDTGSPAACECAWLRGAAALN